jgi:hypothetical protein
MTEQVPSDALAYVTTEGDGWRFHLRGWGSIPVKDRDLTVHLIDIAEFAQAKGRKQAFSELRQLIGAADDE